MQLGTNIIFLPVNLTTAVESKAPHMNDSDINHSRLEPKSDYVFTFLKTLY